MFSNASHFQFQLIKFEFYWFYRKWSSIYSYVFCNTNFYEKKL